MMPKQKKAEMITDEAVAVEEANVAVPFGGETEEVFSMLAGYHDGYGTLHNTFTIREMTGKDEEAINRADMKVNTPKIISTLLSRCVTSIGSITPKSAGQANWLSIIKDLYIGDQDYMVLKIREISFGSELTVTSECPNCQSKMQTSIDIDELEQVEFKGEFSYPFTLPSGYRDKKGVVHKTGVIRLANGLDREIYFPVAKVNPSRAETCMLTRLCEFSDGYPINEDVMSSLVMRDRKYLQELLSDSLFGIKADIPVSCTNCGVDYKAAMASTNFI